MIRPSRARQDAAQAADRSGRWQGYSRHVTGPPRIRRIAGALWRGLDDPDSIGVELQRGGWVGVEALAAGCSNDELVISPDDVRDVRQWNAGPRLEFDEAAARVRVAHRPHALEPGVPPAKLYLPVSEDDKDHVLSRGLRRSAISWHFLVADLDAFMVGTMGGRRLILDVDASRMVSDGIAFYPRPRGVWLVEDVPAHALSLHPGLEFHGGCRGVFRVEDGVRRSLTPAPPPVPEAMRTYHQALGRCTYAWRYLYGIVCSIITWTMGDSRSALDALDFDALARRLEEALERVPDADGAARARGAVPALRTCAARRQQLARTHPLLTYSELRYKGQAPVLEDLTPVMDASTLESFARELRAAVLGMQKLYEGLCPADRRPAPFVWSASRRARPTAATDGN